MISSLWPPPHHPRPLPYHPRPLPQVYARHMTIALGFLTPRGVVVAADSQETYGEVKSDTTKVLTAFHTRAEEDEDDGAIAISGAGGSDYLAYIQQEITGAFRGRPQDTLQQFDKELRRLMKEFYKDHVIPFAAQRSNQHSVELVLGAQRRGDRRLWVTAESTVKACSYGAVGSGRAYAESVLRKFHVPDDSSADKLAAFAVFAAKQADLYCGGETIVAHISDNFFTGPSLGEVQRWESAFREYGKVDAAVVRYCLGLPHPDDAGTQPLRTITASLKKLRKILSSNRSAPPLPTQ